MQKKKKAAAEVRRRTGEKEALTESDDGQDDGDGYGHPGNPQGFLAVALRLVRLQAHAALQKTCRQRQAGGSRHRTHVGKKDSLGVSLQRPLGRVGLILKGNRIC